MAKRVYFAFHYQDVIDFRANVVRQHWVTKDREEAGYFDASLWESSRKTGDAALKNLINEGLKGTTATVVLVGSETYTRRWVRYEIIRSLWLGQKLLGVHINSIAGKDKLTKALGPNPFDYLGYRYSQDGTMLELFEAQNGSWIKYKDIDSYKLKDQAPADRRGVFTPLTKVTSVLDWVNDDGYNNFTTWVG